jgi:hypothetical protein
MECKDAFDDILIFFKNNGLHQTSLILMQGNKKILNSFNYSGFKIK